MFKTRFCDQIRNANLQNDLKRRLTIGFLRNESFRTLTLYYVKSKQRIIGLVRGKMGRKNLFHSCQRSPWKQLKPWRAVGWEMPRKQFASGPEKYEISQ